MACTEEFLRGIFDEFAGEDGKAESLEIYKALMAREIADASGATIGIMEADSNEDGVVTWEEFKADAIKKKIISE